MDQVIGKVVVGVVIKMFLGNFTRKTKDYLDHQRGSRCFFTFPSLTSDKLKVTLNENWFLAPDFLSTYDLKRVKKIDFNFLVSNWKAKTNDLEVYRDTLYLH